MPEQDTVFIFLYIIGESRLFGLDWAPAHLGLCFRRPHYYHVVLQTTRLQPILLFSRFDLFSIAIPIDSVAAIGHNRFLVVLILGVGNYQTAVVLTFRFIVLAIISSGTFFLQSSSGLSCQMPAISFEWL